MYVCAASFSPHTHARSLNFSCVCLLWSLLSRARNLRNNKTSSLCSVCISTPRANPVIPGTRATSWFTVINYERGTRPEWLTPAQILRINHGRRVENRSLSKPPVAPGECCKSWIRLTKAKLHVNGAKVKIMRIRVGVLRMKAQNPKHNTKAFS